MQMVYPVSWQIVPLSAQNQIFEADSGDGVDFSVYVTKTQGSAMGSIVAYRESQSNRTDRSYSFSTPTAGTLGGLSSVYMDFTSVNRKNASDVHTAEVQYVVSGGWDFAFEYYTLGTAWRRQDELRAMLRSIIFA